MTVQPGAGGDVGGARGRTVLRGLILTLAGLGWVYALVGAEGINRQKERLDRRELLRQQLAAELAENEALRKEVDALRSDDFAIEQAIRSELDFQRPDEVVVIVEDDDPLGATPRPQVKRVVPPPPPKQFLTPPGGKSGIRQGAGPAPAASGATGSKSGAPPASAGTPAKFSRGAPASEAAAPRSSRTALQKF